MNGRFCGMNSVGYIGVWNDIIKNAGYLDRKFPDNLHFLW